MPTYSASAASPDFVAACEATGLDICHPFCTSVANERLAAEAQVIGTAAANFSLPTFERAAQAFLIGNTRALWPKVRPHILAAPHAHPLNHYVETTLAELAAAQGVPFWLGWSHRGNPQMLPMQRLARAAGLADLAPSHLSAHPRFGPWFALRAVVVFDRDSTLPTPAAPALCAACAQPCVAAFEAARAGQTPTAHAVRADAARWVAVRDACPLGRHFRYGAEQIAYHYAGVIPNAERRSDD